MTLLISAQDARNKFSEMLNTAVYGKKSVVITRFDKPQAVLMDYQEFERLMNPRLRYSDAAWEQGFSVFDRIRAKNKTTSSQHIEQVVNDAVKKARTRTDAASSR